MSSSSPMPDIVENSDYNSEIPNGNDGIISQKASRWDTSKTGRLSKSVRNVIEFDRDGKGYLDIEEARSLGRKIADLSEENTKIRRILCCMTVLVVLLFAATIPAAYFAVTGSQETKVDENGRLVSGKGGAEVSVKTQGVKVNTYRVQAANNKTKTCVSGEDLASAWIENQNGGVATFVIQNDDGYEQVLRLSPSDSRMAQDV
eukprot:scaffold26300_cov137-Cylindrotheca_fusiformis.AAC.1